MDRDRPNIQRGTTGDGYVYYRTRARGVDVTVYEHQVMALQDHHLSDVFDPETDVHHLVPARDVNIREVLELRESGEHRSNGGDKYERD